MKGPEPLDRRRLLAQVLHPMLAIMTPLVFLVFITEVLRSSVGFSLSPWIYLFLLIAGVEEIVTGNILFQERVGSFERFREPIYILALVAAVMLLSQEGSLQVRLWGLRGAPYLYLGVIVLVQWLFTWRFHTALRDRELFQALLEGKEGPDLQLVIRDNAEMARMAISAVPRVKRGIMVFQSFAFVLMVVFFAVGLDVSGSMVVIFLAQAIMGFLFLTVLNNAVEDHLLASDGVSVSPFHRRRRIIQGAVLLGISLVVIALFARRTSLFPLSIFGPLIDWLRALMNREIEAGPLPPIPTNVPRPQRDLMALLEQGQSEPSPWIEVIKFILRVIWNIIKWAALVVLAYLLISPFLSRYFRTRLKALKPLAFLQEQVGRLAQFLFRLWDELLAWLRRPPAERQEQRRRKQRDWVRSLRIRRPGMFKRMEMGRVLRAYVKLIRWGGRRGVPFRVSYAPREYADRLCEKLPEYSRSLTEVMVILEQALFSPMRIGRQRVSVYLKTIREITGRRV